MAGSVGGSPNANKDHNVANHSIVNDVPITPLEACILHMLYFSNRTLARSEIVMNVMKVFNITDARYVDRLLKERMARGLGYVRIGVIRADGRITGGYSLSENARNTYFSRAAMGGKAGNALHMDTMFQIADAQMRMGRYCRLNFDDAGNGLPNMLVLEPETCKYDHGAYFSPDRWNENTAIAVEVETDPTKHAERIYKNWKKHNGMRLEVRFIVYSEKHANTIREVLASKKDVDPSSYTIATITKDDVVNKVAGSRLRARLGRSPGKVTSGVQPQ